MSLMKWKPKNRDPFYDMFNFDQPFWGLSLFPSLEQIANNSNRAIYPKVDLKEYKDKVVLNADLPGIKKEDIELFIDGSVLTIRGERSSEKEENSDNKEGKYYFVERSFGIFQRSVDLGTAINQDEVKAKYKNGVLEITIPKSEQESKRKVEIE